MREQVEPTAPGLWTHGGGRTREFETRRDITCNITNGTVRYGVPHAEGESEKETKMRADRHRHREEVALQWLSYGVTRPTSGHMLWKPRGHHGYGVYSSKGRRKTK